jgi:hypothetical protein
MTSGCGLHAAPEKPEKAPAAPRPFRLLYNSDGNNIFQGERRADDPKKRWHERSLPPREPISVEELLQFVDEVADSQVDTFLLCPVNNQVVTYRSAIEKRLGDGATDEQLATSHYSLQNTVRALRHFDELGVDPFELLVKRIKEKKMRAMVSYRVQQAHAIGGKEKSAAISPFWEQHPEYRLHGNGGGESGSALDFAVPEVRARKVALLRELVTKYGFDGCELDFQRFPLFFQKGKEVLNIPSMNTFVRDVRLMLDEEGKKVKRKLTLGVRVPETPARCRELGLDPAAWVNEGLLDFVVVTKFLAQNPTTVYAIPHFEEDFEAFRKSFHKPVALLGSIQMAYSFKSAGPRSKTVQYSLSPDDYRREAAALWSKKVDGIELFNFFLFRAKWDARGDRTEPPFFLLKELGDPKTIGQIHTPEEEKWTRAYPRKPIPPEILQQLNQPLQSPNDATPDAEPDKTE